MGKKFSLLKSKALVYRIMCEGFKIYKQSHYGLF